MTFDQIESGVRCGELVIFASGNTGYRNQAIKDDVYVILPQQSTKDDSNVEAPTVPTR